MTGYKGLGYAILAGFILFVIFVVVLAFIFAIISWRTGLPIESNSDILLIIYSYLLLILFVIFVFILPVYAEYKINWKGKNFEKKQKAKGLVKHFGEWISKEEQKRILEHQAQQEEERRKQWLKEKKEIEKAEKEKERKIKKLLKKYSSVCRDCEHGYHRRSSESHLCPKCHSNNIENR